MTFPLAPGKPLGEDLPLHEIEDHADRGLARLLTQFKKMPRFVALIRILFKPLQEVEGVLWDLKTGLTLADAIGEQLDLIGRILQEPRGTLSDDDYRTVLSIKILVLRSSGRAPELIHILEVLASGTFLFTEYFPAAIVVDLITAPTFNVALVARFLRKAKAAGVRLDVTYGDDLVRYASDLDVLSGTGGYSSDLDSFDTNGFYAGDI